MATELENLGKGKDPVQEIDAKIGTYKPSVPRDAVEGRLPTEAVPKAPDPSPFSGMK